MKTRWLTHDPALGKYTKSHEDEHTGDVIIENQYDIEPIIENNKRAYNQYDARSNWKGDWHHVAEIPLHIALELWTSGKAYDEKYMARWLNDPDNKPFRWRPGRI